MKQKKWWMLAVAAASLASLAPTVGASAALTPTHEKEMSTIPNDKGLTPITVTPIKDDTKIFVTSMDPKDPYKMTEYTGIKLKKGDKVQTFCKFTAPSTKETWYLIGEFFFGKGKEFEKADKANKAEVPDCPKGSPTSPTKTKR